MRNKIAELKTYKVEPKCAEVIHAAFALLGTDPKEVLDRCYAPTLFFLCSICCIIHAGPRNVLVASASTRDLTQ